MRLSTKGRYAVMAMADLVVADVGKPVPLADVAQRQEISLSYLEQLFGRLRRAGLVSSVRGPGGGYRLARPMNEVTVADIIAAVDEPLDATNCGGRENCHDEHRCMTHDLWTNLNKRMHEYLASVSLLDLVNQPKAKAIAAASVTLDDRLRSTRRDNVVFSA